jgi:hypothetical protein
MAASEIGTAAVKAKRGHGLLYTLLGIFVILLIGAGAAFYLRPDMVLNLLGIGLPNPIPEEQPAEEAPYIPPPATTTTEILPISDATTTASTTSATTTEQ